MKTDGKIININTDKIRQNDQVADSKVQTKIAYK